jgi:cob(I)alamin adenosyltransferase
MSESGKKKKIGTTSSGSGKILPKDDPFCEAVGTLDELNAHLGLIAAELKGNDDADFIQLIQKQLSSIMSELAFAPEKSAIEDDSGNRKKGITENKDSNPSNPTAYLATLEEEIESLKSKPGKTTGFVLPGRTQIDAYIHIARTVCRRAERRMVSMKRQYEVSDESLLFINKLSTYLFYLSCSFDK